MSELIVAQNIHTEVFSSDSNLDPEEVIKEEK